MKRELNKYLTTLSDKELISDSRNFGWGVYDELHYYYHQCFVDA